MKWLERSLAGTRPRESGLRGSSLSKARRVPVWQGLLHADPHLFRQGHVGEVELPPSCDGFSASVAACVCGGFYWVLSVVPSAFCQPPGEPLAMAGGSQCRFRVRPPLEPGAGQWSAVLLVGASCHRSWQPEHSGTASCCCYGHPVALWRKGPHIFPLL